MRWEVRASGVFWDTLKPLRESYGRDQMVTIILTIKECIEELAEKGYVDVNGWADHILVKRPYADGCHFEFHIHDDDVLVVYFKVERKRRIRMVGVFTHETIPTERFKG